MFLFVCWQVFHYSPGGKLVIYPGFSNAVFKTLWTYTFYVMVFNCWWNKVINAKGLENKVTQQKLFSKKGVLRNFAKFTGKHQWQSLFFDKVAGLFGRPATLFKKKLWHRCFTANFTKFLRAPFLTEHFRWLWNSTFSWFAYQVKVANHCLLHQKSVITVSSVKRIRTSML